MQRGELPVRTVEIELALLLVSTRLYWCLLKIAGLVWEYKEVELGYKWALVS